MMTPQETLWRPHRMIPGLVIATEVAAVGALQLWSGVPVLLWLTSPFMQMTAILGAVITGLLYSCGDVKQAEWSVLIFTAFALAVAIIQILAITAVLG